MKFTVKIYVLLQHLLPVKPVANEIFNRNLGLFNIFWSQIYKFCDLHTHWDAKLNATTQVSFHHRLLLPSSLPVHN
jgi:hypothetical protein